MHAGGIHGAGELAKSLGAEGRREGGLVRECKK